MKTTSFFLIFLLLTSISSAQSYLASLENPKVHKSTSMYDGQNNYLRKKVYLYVGEKMRFRCDSRHENNDSSFVLGFTVDYKIKRDKYGFIYPAAYHPSKMGIGTDYHTIANNYFLVLDVISHPWANPENEKNEYNQIYYLRLYNTTLKDTAYYEYIAVDKERYFPFIVTRHEQYLKNKYSGKFYQIIGESNETIEVIDYETNNQINIACKSWWKCIDMVTDTNNCDFSLILERENKKIAIPLLTASYLLK